MTTAEVKRKSTITIARNENEMEIRISDSANPTNTQTFYFDQEVTKEDIFGVLKVCEEKLLPAIVNLKAIANYLELNPVSNNQNSTLKFTRRETADKNSNWQAKKIIEDIEENEVSKNYVKGEQEDLSLLLQSL